MQISAGQEVLFRPSWLLFPNEMAELLSIGIKFLDFGLFEIELEFFIMDMDDLRLVKRSVVFLSRIAPPIIGAIYRED